MAARLRVIILLVCLLDSCASYEKVKPEQKITLRQNKKPCLVGISCASSEAGYLRELNSASRNCRSDRDCIDEQYCHGFHKICLRRHEMATVASVRRSVDSCSIDSDCRTLEYCHTFWKICLPSPTVYRRPPTKRPPWYCRSSKDCKKNEQCHKRFHACYKRPGMSTVRRDTGNSRRCDKASDCGANFYCHDHFRICLKHTPIVTPPPTTSTQSCNANVSCPKGMICHDFWNICYTPPRVVTLQQENKTQPCLFDSDCKANEFCHSMTTGQVIGRQRRNAKRMCLPSDLRQFPKNDEDIACKTDAECGANRSCLGKLGICMAYKLPGEMCLIEKTDFVSPCASGAYCKTRGKWASPRRIINKMKLPKRAADYLLKKNNKKKRKVGKCVPASI